MSTSAIGDCVIESASKVRRLCSEKEEKEEKQEQVKAIAESKQIIGVRVASQVPPLLRETFTPNDPVHGLIHLPEVVRAFVDTLIFQRMRHIKQLGICSHVFPGATHNRFFHSIGCAHLAHELVKGLRTRQPELGITDRDALCVTLAALCHDIGHPCYSHTFEVFMHSLGRQRRLTAELNAEAHGVRTISPEVIVEIQNYERWNHEQASLSLMKLLFSELSSTLEHVGLTADEAGDDFQCMCELVDPPKSQLSELLQRNELHQRWSSVISGRPVAKAWMYEVVSNWRSSIDVDKFDYFRRDALYLGIQRQFDHWRYIHSIKVRLDSGGVPTISPPVKEKDSLRENMFELRKMLHRTAFQHKTSKKLEFHMIDILEMMEKTVRITDSKGNRISMSQAALEVDRVAYLKLTDTFIEAKLLEGECDELASASAEYHKRFVLRDLMRLVGAWDLPRAGEVGLPLEGGPVPLPTADVIINEVHDLYCSDAQKLHPQKAVHSVSASELRCNVAAFHYGMDSHDPMSRVVFHSKTSDAEQGFTTNVDAKPFRQKIFFFWNPSACLHDDVTLQRLTMAFDKWAQNQVENHRKHVPLSTPDVLAPTQNKRRALRIQASCPLSMPDPS